MGKGVIAGGILGGLILFAWGGLAHTVLPLGRVGFQSLPHEDVVLPALRQAAPGAGLFFFPGLDLDHATDEALAAWAVKYKAGPSGLLIMPEPGTEHENPGQFIRQIGVDLFCGLVAASLLAQCAARSYGARLLFVTVLGLLGSVLITVPFWNWYHFPADFTAATITESVVGFLLAGLAMAKIVKPAT